MTNEPVQSMLTAKPVGEATEVEISIDMIKRGLIAAPALIAVCGVIWGANGAWSSAYAIAIVLVNFALSAAIIAVGSRISYAALLGGVLFGYLFRLALIFLAVWVVKDTSWISMPAVGVSIIVTHFGLLFWELKYVAISLAYPGLKPQSQK
jgi:hypothetical protein